MSTNPDDLAALSPAERDFALRRMPVNDPLVEAYHAANVVPDGMAAPVTPSRFVKSKVDKLCLEMGAGSMWLRAAGLESLADDVVRLAAEIDEALK